MSMPLNLYGCQILKFYHNQILQFVLHKILAPVDCEVKVSLGYIVVKMKSFVPALIITKEPLTIS